MNDAKSPGKADQSSEVIYIGPITEDQRLSKVRHYLHKKHNKSTANKHTYICRKHVADKRLRIKGRFVTKEQAFEILGLTRDQLLDNERIQELLTQHAANPLKINSLIESGDNENIFKV